MDEKAHLGLGSGLAVAGCGGYTVEQLAVECSMAGAQGGPVAAGDKGKGGSAGVFRI